MTTKRIPGPLDDVLVVDFSRVVAGPTCGRSLADLGARVVKIEPPEGDLTRHDHPRVGGISSYFAQQNAGKECVSLDLGRPEGRALALELAAQADVVVENFRPGVADRLGVGYDHVSARRREIVYCSISGFGQHGTDSQRRAYAPVVHGEAGLMDLVAREHDRPVANEIIVWGDVLAGLHAANAVLGALRHRDRTGLGAHLDIAMAEAVLASMPATAPALSRGPDTPPTIFNSVAAPVLTLGDGTVVICPGDPAVTFPAWASAMGRDDLLADDRFVDRDSRRRNHDEVLGLLRAFAAGFDDLASFEAAAGRVRLAVGRVRSIADAVLSDWARERGAVVDVGDDPVPIPRGAIRSDAFHAGARDVLGWQGEHNRSVLSDLLGIRDDEVDRLVADGVLIERRPGGA